MALGNIRGGPLTEVVCRSFREPLLVPSVLQRHELVDVGLS